MSAAVLVVGCAGLGALAGAAVPRLAYRLSVPPGQAPRAAYGHCAGPLPGGWAGWLCLGAGCPGCPARLGPPAPVTAALGAGVCGLPAWAVAPRTGADALVLAAFLLAGLAGVLLGAVDLACLRLPDVVVGPLSAGTLALLTGAAALTGQGAALARAGAAAAALAGGHLVLALLPGARLGLGDVKLCAPLGLLLGWLGWPAVLWGAALPHVINGSVVLGLLVTRRADRHTELPLGPALLVGALAAAVGHAVWSG